VFKGWLAAPWSRVVNVSSFHKGSLRPGKSALIRRWLWETTESFTISPGCMIHRCPLIFPWRPGVFWGWCVLGIIFKVHLVYKRRMFSGGVSTASLTNCLCPQATCYTNTGSNCPSVKRGPALISPVGASLAQPVEQAPLFITGAHASPQMARLRGKSRFSGALFSIKLQYSRCMMLSLILMRWCGS